MPPLPKIRSGPTRALGLCLATLLVSAFATAAAAQTPDALAARSLVVIDDICTQNGGQLGLASCNISQDLGGAEQTQATLQVTPREGVAAASNATQTTTSQIEGERDRLQERRKESGAGAQSTGRLGTFLNGTGGFGWVDARGEAEGYDVYGAGVMLGVDYRFTDQIVGGIGFGWNHQESEFDSETDAGATNQQVGGGDSRSHSYTASLYGSFFEGPFFIDGVVTYTYVDYEFRRAVDLLNLPSQPGGQIRADARGDTDAHQFGVTAGGGYDFQLNGATLGPIAQVEFLRTWIDGYRESGVPLFGLDFDDQDIESLVTSVGGQVSYAISTPCGVISPYARGTWEHEYLNSARSIRGRLFEDTSPASDTLVSRTSSPDRNYARVGGGVAAQLPRGFSAFVDYDTLLGLSKVQYHRLSIGGRLEF